jgi:hypothetical protein
MIDLKADNVHSRHSNGLQPRFITLDLLLLDHNHLPEIGSAPQMPVFGVASAYSSQWTLGGLQATGSPPSMPNP